MRWRRKPKQWTPKPVPAEVQKAREELAHRVLADPTLFPLGILHAERIVSSSTWRMKLGGSFECAVCERDCDDPQRDLCGDHDNWRFLWYHHAGSAGEHRELTVKQLFSIAGLPLPERTDQDVHIGTGETEHE